MRGERSGADFVAAWNKSLLPHRLRVPPVIFGLAAFIVGYCFLAVAEYALRLPSGVPLLALSSGLAVGVYSRLTDMVLWIFAAAQFVVLTLIVVGAGATILAGLGIGATTAMTCALTATVYVASRRKLPSWSGFIVLLLAAVSFSAIGAILHFAFLIVEDSATPVIVLLTWWVASATGIILTSPAVIMFRRSRVALTRRRLVELVAACTITVVVLFSLWNRMSVAAEEQTWTPYILVPLVLWFAVRFGMAVTAIVASVVNLVIVTAIHSGLGPVSEFQVQTTSLIGLQLGLTLVAMAVYCVALNEEQRRSRDLELAAANGLVDSLLVNSDAMISIRQYDSRGNARYVLANPRFARALGKRVNQIVGRSHTEVDTDLAAVADARAEDLEVLSSNQSQVFITKTVSGATDESAAGTAGSRVYLITKFPVASADGESRSVGSIALDITDHRRRERLMRLTFDESPVPMVRLAWRAGQAGEVLDANRSAAHLLRIPVSSLVGMSLDRFTHPDEAGMQLVPADGVVGESRQREARLVRGDGEDVWVKVTATVVEPSDDVTAGAVGTHAPEDVFALVVLEDITARRLAEQTLTHQALHDALTGVLNRYALVDRLEAAISRLWRDEAHIAVLFCDLDGFKTLNDTLGHRAGDQMLISVSERLRAVMRPQDTVARLGGDEFVLICEDLPSPNQARLIGERIREAMRQPFRIDDREYGVTVSVGIATTAEPNTRAEDLLRRADLAMYRAKDNGRNRVEYYAEELEQRAVAHLEATEALRRAIAEDNIVVHYQPIMDLASGRVVGVEALARLRAEDGSLVQPSSFISVAESSGLVAPMGERVLQIALDQLQAWITDGIDVQLNVNVSPRQLARSTFAPMVFEHLMTRGLAPSALCLEITEGAVVEAAGPTLITLRRLRSYGVHVGIDDFGTGFSSLTTLKYLAADVLKVDRSFVEGLGKTTNDSAIVGAVVRIAHDLGCVVVAEGVESAEQAVELTRMGCDFVQGYRYGRPMPAEDIYELLSANTADPREVDITDRASQRK